MRRRNFAFSAARPYPRLQSAYRLPDGGLDLDKAASDLVRRRRLEQFAQRNLILVTTEPYSAPDGVSSEVEGALLPGYFHDSDVLGDGNVSVVSTFLWDHLSSRPDLEVLAPSGRRVRTPYLLMAFATIVIGKFLDTECHHETFACPNDYCDNIEDVDAFFARQMVL